MGFGKILKIFIYFVIVIFGIAVILSYSLKIIPTSLGVHPQLYKSSGIALDGFDIVNYQTKKTANKGNVTYKYKLNDTHWIFMSKSNLKLFSSGPTKYIPQFGGFCTYSISKGYTYPPDPKIYRYYKRKLYFFKDEETKELALADWENTIKNANLNWK